MGKSDRRVQYTKKVLKEALLELMKTKTIDELTIKEICALADINRGTFYLHYSQPREILMEIEQSFIQEMTAIFNEYWEREHDISRMEAIFQFILENNSVSRILLGDHGDPHFLRDMDLLCREDTVNEWKKEFPNYPAEHLEYLFDFVFTGSMRLILNWIDDNQGLSAEEFAHRLERLGHYSLVAAGEFHK